MVPPLSSTPVSAVVLLLGSQYIIVPVPSPFSPFRTLPSDLLSCRVPLTPVGVGPTIMAWVLEEFSSCSKALRPIGPAFTFFTAL